MDKWIIDNDLDTKMYRCPHCEARMIKKEYDAAVGFYGHRFCPYCGTEIDDSEFREAGKCVLGLQ